MTIALWAPHRDRTVRGEEVAPTAPDRGPLRRQFAILGGERHSAWWRPDVEAGMAFEHAPEQDEQVIALVASQGCQEGVPCIVDVGVEPVQFRSAVSDEPLEAAVSSDDVQHDTRRWSRIIAGFDGLVFVTPEYNPSVPAALKNAWSGTTGPPRS